MAQSPVEVDGSKVTLRVPEPLHKAAVNGSAAKDWPKAEKEKSYPVDRLTYTTNKTVAKQIVLHVAAWTAGIGDGDTQAARHTAQRGRIWVRKVCDRMGLDVPNLGAAAAPKEKRAKGEPKVRTRQRPENVQVFAIGDEVRIVDWPTEGDREERTHTIKAFRDSEGHGLTADLSNGEGKRFAPVTHLILVHKAAPPKAEPKLTGVAKKVAQQKAATAAKAKAIAPKKVTRKGATKKPAPVGTKTAAMRKAREAKASK